MEQQKRYYDYLKINKPELYTGSLEGTEVFLNTVMLQVLDSIENHYAPQLKPKPTVETNGGTIISGPKDSSKPK